MIHYSNKCSDHCYSCIFAYTDGCHATPHRSHFKQINGQQAQLILNNKDRFPLNAKQKSRLKKIAVKEGSISL
ncbi:hypothetical protein FHS86_001962 [Roseimarinus sediminis]